MITKDSRVGHVKCEYKIVIRLAIVLLPSKRAHPLPLLSHALLDRYRSRRYFTSVEEASVFVTAKIRSSVAAVFESRIKDAFAAVAMPVQLTSTVSRSRSIRDPSTTL